MASSSVQVWNAFYFTLAASDAQNSPPIAMLGNTAVLAIIVINSTGVSGTNTAFMQGSYDGNAWTNIGSGVAVTGFGPFSYSATTVNYPFLRVRVVASAASGCTFMLNACICMSDQ